MINIMELMSLSSSLDEQFVEKVLNRLESSYKFELNGEDSYPVYFSIMKIENHIKNQCNVSSIPKGLEEIAVDMICADFLLTKKQTGQLNLENLDLDTPVKTIKEGDTSVEFVSGASASEKFETLLRQIEKNSRGELLCYRRIRW